MYEGEYEGVQSHVEMNCPIKKKTVEMKVANPMFTFTGQRESRASLFVHLSMEQLQKWRVLWMLEVHN